MDYSTQQYKFSDPDLLSVDIIQAIAEFKGVALAEVDPPLFEVINSTALENLFKNTDDYVWVQFQYQELEIVARTDGQIHITESRDGIEA